MLTDNKKKIENILEEYFGLVGGNKFDNAVKGSATDQILSLCESIRAEALKDCGELKKKLPDRKDYLPWNTDNRTAFWEMTQNVLGYNQGVIDVLAKLSKGDDEEEICICGQDDPTANGMRMDIICPKHDET
jgi:hypothetical protein